MAAPLQGTTLQSPLFQQNLDGAMGILKTRPTLGSLLMLLRSPSRSASPLNSKAHASARRLIQFTAAGETEALTALEKALRILLGQHGALRSTLCESRPAKARQRIRLRLFLDQAEQHALAAWVPHLCLLPGMRYVQVASSLTPPGRSQKGRDSEPHGVVRIRPELGSIQ